MAIYMVLKSKTPKVDARTLFECHEDNEGTVIGYTLTVQYKDGPCSVKLNAQRLPTNVVDAATVASIWAHFNSDWDKDSKRFLQQTWARCDAFTFNQHCPIPGEKGLWYSSPTTLPCVVLKPTKRSRFTA